MYRHDDTVGIFGHDTFIGKIKFKFLFHGPKWLSKQIQS